MSEPLTTDQRAVMMQACQEALDSYAMAWQSAGFADGAALLSQCMNRLSETVDALEARVAALTEERDFAIDSADRSVREYDLANARAVELHKRLAALTTLFGADQENWTDLGWVRNQLVEANKETLELRASLAAAQADSEKIESTIGAAINMAARLICAHPLKIDTDELDRRSCYDCYAAARAKLLPILCGLRAAKAGGDT